MLGNPRDMISREAGGRGGKSFIRTQRARHRQDDRLGPPTKLAADPPSRTRQTAPSSAA
jgi:hypothetical protein